MKQLSTKGRRIEMLITLLTVLIVGIVLVKVVKKGIEVLAFIVNELKRTVKRIIRQAKRSVLAFLAELKNALIETAVTSYFQLIGKIEQ
jgi:hypothetical protein